MEVRPAQQLIAVSVGGSVIALAPAAWVVMILVDAPFEVLEMWVSVSKVSRHSAMHARVRKTRAGVGYVVSS